MSKILEKSLKDARKENRLTMGSKEVLNSVNNSKLIVLSQSVDKKMPVIKNRDLNQEGANLNA